MAGRRPRDVRHRLVRREGGHHHPRALPLVRPKLYEEDCVELFLAPHADERARYVEVEVGPFGHFLDLAVDRRVKPVRSDVSWSSVRPGARLPIGLYRMEGKSSRGYVPEAFGTLVVE